MVCLHDACTRRASYGSAPDCPDGPGVPIHCAVHKAPGEIDLMHRRCGAAGCFKVPIFGSPTDGVRRWCNAHRSLDIHVDLMHRTCTRALCGAPSTYGVLGDKCPTYCKQHKVDDMVLITPETRRRLDSEWEEWFKLAVAHLASGAAVPKATNTPMASDASVKPLPVESWLTGQLQLLGAGLLSGSKALNLARLLATAKTEGEREGGGETAPGKLYSAAGSPRAASGLLVTSIRDSARAHTMGEPVFMWHRDHVERARARRRASVVTNCAGGEKMLRVEMQRRGPGSAADTDATGTHGLEREQEHGQAGSPEKQAQTRKAVQTSVHRPASPTSSSDPHNISIPAQVTDYTCANRRPATSSCARDARANGTADFMLALKDHQQESEQRPVELGQEFASGHADALQQDAEALQRSLAAALQACKVRNGKRICTRAHVSLHYLVSIVVAVV